MLNLSDIDVDQLVKLLKEDPEFCSKINKALNKLKVEELECLKKNNTQLTI